MGILHSPEAPLIQWNENEYGKRITTVVPNESIKVLGNQAQLTYKPAYFFKVFIDPKTINETLVTFNEIALEKPIESIGQYKVNYNNGIIYFHPDVEGNTLNVSSYNSEGLILYPSSRIYYKDSSGVVHTFEDMPEEFQTAEATRQSTFETNEAAREAEFDTLIETAYTAQEAVKKFAYLDAALGNSIQFTDMIDAVLAELEIRGETLCKKAVFTTSTVRIDGVSTLPFVATDTLTFVGTSISANNKSAVLSSKTETASYVLLTFPASTFTAGYSLVGTITDGTDTFDIAVSPSYPQVLTSLTSFDYTVSGKNLLKYPYSDATKTLNGLTFTVNGDGSITVNGTATATTYFNLILSTSPKSLKAGTYTVSGGTSSIKILFRKVTGDTTIATDTGSGATFTLADATTIYGFISILSGVTVSNVTIYPQLEKASTKSAWEAYQGTTATITLKDTSNNQLENRGIPLTYNTDGSVATWGTQDRVFKDTDGKWKLQPYDFTKALNGTETWYTSKAGVYWTVIANGKYTAASVPGLMTHYKNNLSVTQVNNGTVDKQFNLGSTGMSSSACALVVSDSSYATVEAFKTYLADQNTAGTPVTLRCPYKTPPAAIELCAADQAAIATVEKTFSGITNIMLGSNLGQVYAVGAKNITTVINNLTAAIAALG